MESAKERKLLEIAALLRKNYPDITFVSAGVQGTRLLLTIQEVLEETLQEEAVPCDLIADFDGEIVKHDHKKRRPQNENRRHLSERRPSHIRNCRDFKRQPGGGAHEYVSADANIYVRHQIPYYQGIFPFLSEKIADGKPKNSWYFHIGNWILKARAARPGAAYHFRGRNPLAGHRKFCPPISWKNHPHALPD